VVSTATGSFAKLDSLEKISEATFRITGLTKTPQIEFLPLDWIYCSIRIITVCHMIHIHTYHIFGGNLVCKFV